jgi:hypothetical protein
LFYAPEVAALLQPLLDASGATIDKVCTPSFEQLVENETVPVFTFGKTFDEVKDTNVFCLHTSGTSGPPKPLYWNHMAISTISSCLDSAITAMNGTESNLMRNLVDGCNTLVLFPLGHVRHLANRDMYNTANKYASSVGWVPRSAVFTAVLQ